MRLSFLTLTALVAFAGNSLLARAAIGGDAGSAAIGPLAFTLLRLAAGAGVLAALAAWGGRRRTVAATAPPAFGSGRDRTLAAVTLGAYALGFSVAYVALDAATGALLLFAAVQLTIAVAALRAGERVGPRRALGWTAATGGLLVLLAPGATAPAPAAGAAMVVAGIAWGGYTLVGRRATAPLAANATSFLWAAVALAPLAALPTTWHGTTAIGAALAVASGALTSGLGYAAWYAALPRLSRATAAIVQLAVPVVAAAGAVVLLGEDVGVRLLLAGALVVGGVGIAVAAPTVRGAGSPRGA